MNALIAEAVALCEAAQERFKELQEELAKAINEGRALTNQYYEEDLKARKALFDARLKLSQRQRNLRKLTETGE